MHNHSADGWEMREAVDEEFSPIHHTEPAQQMAHLLPPRPWAEIHRQCSRPRSVLGRQRSGISELVQQPQVEPQEEQEEVQPYFRTKPNNNPHKVRGSQEQAAPITMSILAVPLTVSSLGIHKNTAAL